MKLYTDPVTVLSDFMLSISSVVSAQRLLEVPGGNWISLRGTGKFVSTETLAVDYGGGLVTVKPDDREVYESHNRARNRWGRA